MMHDDLTKRGLSLFGHALNEGSYRHAAFQAHQLVEGLYTWYLLVHTFYSPPTHNISRLRSLAEGRDERFRDVWPTMGKFERRSFQRLKDAYVKGRYSEHYEIERDELVWLGERVSALRALVKTACDERVAELRAEAEG